MPAKRKPRVSKQKRELVTNAFTEAILGFNPGTGSPFDTTQLSQVNTLFKNNRWYLVSNMRQVLSEIYVEHGLIQTVVDVPVDDGLRGGVDIKTKQLSENQIEQIRTIMEKENDIGVVGQGLKWNRLFGGAGVMIWTNQDPMKPLNVQAIDKSTPLEFKAVDMWELFWDQQNTEGYDAGLESELFEFYSYYSKKIHKSRVMKMKGLIAPSFIRPRLRGWGFSIIESFIRSINQYLKANDLVFEVLDEFKIDVYKMKNLASTLLLSGGTELVRRRIQTMNANKNYQNAVTMDAEDDYVQKELTFAGLAETMHGIRLQIASDLRMPLTKIFGISATGFNSGEDDIENYNSMVESQIRQKCKFDILKIIELRCQKEFGFIPDDLSITFKSLRILGAEQEENVKTQQFNRLIMARERGEISSLDFKEACNKQNLLGIQLDTSVDTIDMGDESMEGSGNPADGRDMGEVGGNKTDTRKVAPLEPKMLKAPQSSLVAKEAKA